MPDPVCVNEDTTVQFNQHFDRQDALVKAEVRGNSTIKQEITLTYGETAAAGGSISEIKFKGQPFTANTTWNSFRIRFLDGRYKVVIEQLTYEAMSTFIGHIQVVGSFSSPGVKKLTISTRVWVITPRIGGPFLFTGSAEEEVTVCKVDIVEPNENDVFLHGDRVTFRAEVEPSGVTVESWNWEILQGTGSPRSSNTDTYEPIVKNEDKDFENPDTFKVEVTAVVNGQTCTDDRSIKVVYPRISKINFHQTKPVRHESDWAVHDPEWTSAVTDKSVSVFTRGTDIEMTVTFEVKENLTNNTTIDQLYADAAAWVRGNPDCWNVSLEIAAGTKSGDFFLDGVTNLPNDIYAYDLSTGRRRIAYEWYYKISGTNDKYVIDPTPAQNKHALYVTLKDPAPATPYETLLYITCRAAGGQTSAAGANNKIWKEFKDCVVKRKDGAPLQYWGPIALGTNIQTTDLLLRLKDGRCGAWVRMFRDCSHTHSIPPGGIQVISPPPRPGLLEPRLLIKHYNMNVTPPIDLRGIKGQSNPDPKSVFSNHGVVTRAGKILDPSYGKLFTTQNEWEDKSVAGFRYVELGPPAAYRYFKNVKKVQETGWAVFPFP